MVGVNPPVERVEKEMQVESKRGSLARKYRSAISTAVKAM
jgi:hypothetical protein